MLVLLAGLAVAPAEATPARVAATAGQDSPDPFAAHTTNVIPGITGAAVKAALPAGAAERFTQLHARTAGASRAVVESATAAAATAALAPWDGARQTFWGTAINSGFIGAQATQSFGRQLSSWDGDTIYAPTLFPASTTTIEMTTVEWSNGVWVSAWDWGSSSPDFKKMVLVSDLANYVTTVQGLPSYTVQLVQTNATTNNWTAYLFNYHTRAWDPFYSSANAAKLTNPGTGWDAFEAYSDYYPSTGEGRYCSDTRGVTWATSGLRFLTSARRWVNATNSNSSIGTDMPVNTCSTLVASVVTANSYWKVRN